MGLDRASRRGEAVRRCGRAQTMSGVGWTRVMVGRTEAEVDS